MKKLHLLSVIFLIIIFYNFGCGPKTIFSIKKNYNPPHAAFGQFSNFVDVFGVKIYAMADVGDTKLLHAANILAQYLDNDEDGKADNQKVLDAMLSNKAFVVMVKTGDSPDIGRFFRANPPEDMIGQDLYDEETIPGGAANGRFDASLEELLHIVTHAGYAFAYPSIFGEFPGTEVANSMDIARAGRFETVPEKYPGEAWYSYYDETCDYGCQVAEYTYWALTSILGGQDFPGRLERIQDEWRLNTREKVKNGDPAVYQILTDPQYRLPSVLPDGTYRR